MRRRVVVGIGLAVAVLIIVLIGMRVRAPASSESPNSAAGSGVSSIAANVPRARVPAKPASLSGRVTRAADGVAIAGAVVAVARAELSLDFMPSDQPTLIAITDATGAWSLSGVLPGDYNVGVSATGFLPAEREKLAIASGEQRSGIDVALVAGGVEVRGTVTDVGGGPIADARITAQRQQMTMRRNPEVVAVTGPDGTYRLTLSDGAYSISAEHDDYTDAEQTIDIAGQPETVDFVLTPGAVIRGRVIARDTRQPVSRALVQASVGSGNVLAGRNHASAIADDNGVFQLRGLSSGAVSIRAVGRGYASTDPTVVEVSIAETVEGVEVVVDRAYAISGRVVTQADPKHGIPGVQVGAFSFANGGDALPAPEPTDDQGAFEILGVRAGTYLLFAGVETMMPEIGQSVTVVDRDVTDVVLQLSSGVTLSGRVAPVASATITLELKGEIGLANMFEMVKAMATRAETDASGAFQLHHAPSGAFNLVARTKDGTTGRLEVSIGTTDQTGLVIPITPRASIAGKVVDTRGTPVPGMRVTVKRDGDREGAMRITMDGLNNEVTTRADGSFKIVGLEPGTYAVHARDPKDYSHVTAEARDKPVEVELAEAQARTGVTLTVEARDGVIRGVVIGADRKPAADAWVTARLENPDSDPEETSFLELASSEPVLTAADGRFAIERLRKGTYRLVVEGPRGSSRGEKSGIKTGDSVTITLAPLGTLAIRASSRGAPVTSYDLSCDGPSDVSRHVSSADGSYKLERVAPGDYTCSASAQIGTAGAKVNVPAGPAQLDLTFTPWASLTGLVVNAVSGAPVQGALVIPRSDLRSNNGAEIFEAITGKGPTTDAAGRFVIERVPEGPGIVMVFATGASMSSPLQSQSYKAVAGQRLDVGTIKVIAPVTGDPGTFGLATEPGGTGLKVTMVVDGGPAAAAGLKVDDVIVSIDGRPVTDIGVDTAGLLLSSGSVGVGQTIRLGLTSGATIAVTSVKWG